METTQSDGWQIVLIDDEADIREVTSLTLKDAGYKVETAADGVAGLDLFRKVSPQIVVTDIRMPRMGGLEVLEKIKQTGSDTEVIVVTAFGEMDLAIRALQLDASDFITKPINDKSLHLSLQRARERYTARKQVRDYTALLEKEQVRTFRELSRTLAIQRCLIESAMDGILGCDDKGKIVTVNQCMREMLDFSDTLPDDRLTLDQIIVPDRVKEFWNLLSDQKLGGRGKLIFYETFLVGPGNVRIPVQVSATRIAVAEGGISLVCFFRDLRRLLALEREVEDQARILHQDKMISLGRLAASVIHEINNPLAGVLNYIRLMSKVLNRGPLSEDRREKFQGYLDLIESETDRCSHILSSLLTFSRKTPLTHCDVDAGILITRSVLLCRHKLELTDVKLETDISNELPTVWGNFNQLQQCIINLIFNAIDAMPEGGRLNVSGRQDKKVNAIEIAVRDTGKGVDAADLPYIFEPFFTTKKEGAGVGLGLSTTYAIIEKHSGTLTVENNPGKGCTFKIVMPVKTPTTHQRCI